MGDKPEPKAVRKLAADAAARKAAAQKAKKTPTVAKQMRLRGKQQAAQPKPKGEPKNVLKLISDALNRRQS